MDLQVFERLLDEIYGAFGRQRPTISSPAYKTLKRRVCEEASVPNEAAKHIAYALAEYDSLPLNLGKAILREFQHWLSENPQKRAVLRGCPECSKDFPGFFWVNDGSKDYLCKCACNTDPSWDKQPAWTHRQAREAGMFIGTRLECQDRQWAAANAASLPGTTRRAIGHSEPARPMHQQQREYYDAASW